jgi:hypothetical protein
MRFAHASALTALLVLLFVDPAAAQGRLPWSMGSQPPRFLGATLGEQRPAIQRTLGKPDAEAPIGTPADSTVSLTWNKRGEEIQVHARSGATVISATSRSAGTLEGTRVGDTRDAVIARWGNPSGSDAHRMIWFLGSWAIVLDMAPDATVAKVSLGIMTRR